MRVITGTARGRRLKELEGTETRPTTDRVKEGLFSALQFDIEGRRVLDLFAGTGQLGIECLSRGAASAVFVDRRADAVKLIRENLKLTELQDRSVDMVAAAQAFHWFDGPAFARECRRILRPGGRAVLVWNVRGSAPMNQALAQVFREHCPSFHGFTGGMGEDDPRIRDFFGGAYEKRRFPNPLTLDRDQFLRRCFSSSYALREGDADYEAFRAALEALFDTFASGGQLIQPNETVAYVGIPAAPQG